MSLVPPLAPKQHQCNVNIYLFIALLNLNDLLMALHLRNRFVTEHCLLTDHNYRKMEMTRLFFRRIHEMLWEASWNWVHLYAVILAIVSCITMQSKVGDLKRSFKEEARVVSPMQEPKCTNQEQRSHRNNHVRAETLELWEHNAGERANWDPSSRGDVVCWCWEWAKHRPIYLGKIVLRWGRKYLRSGPPHSSLCNLISALGEDGWKQTLFSCQHLWQNIQCQ